MWPQLGDIPPTIDTTKLESDAQTMEQREVKKCYIRGKNSVNLIVGKEKYKYLLEERTEKHQENYSTEK